MKHNLTPTFSSSRYRYFDIDKDDKSHFSALYGNATTMVKIMNPLDEKEVDSLFTLVTKKSSEQNAHFFKIVCQNGTTAGVMGYLPVESDSNGQIKAEFGILLYPKYYGNGTAKEAITELLAFGFNHLKLANAYAKYNSSNTAIERIARHLNFSIKTIKEAADQRICTIDKTSFLNRFEQISKEKTIHEK